MKLQTILLGIAIPGLIAGHPTIYKRKPMFNKNIVQLAKENSFFRKEIITGSHGQVVLMSIPAGKEIGQETHNVDQILVFVQGKGQAILNDQISEVQANHMVFVPAKTKHNFKNTGTEDLKLYTIYAPPVHKAGTVEKTQGE